MEADVARHVLRAAFRSAGELQQLLPVLKKACGTEEYERYAKAIASVLGEVTIALTNKVLEEHPDLRAEIEAAIAKYDRFV